jgi:hypothetical protein
MTPGLTSSSRANSFIRIFFIEETADNPLQKRHFVAVYSALFMVADSSFSTISSAID